MLPVSTNEKLNDLYNFLYNKELLTKIERQIYYNNFNIIENEDDKNNIDDEDIFISKLNNLKIYLVGESYNGNFIIISDCSSYYLSKIINYKFSDLNVKIFYKNKFKVSGENLYFIYNMKIVNKNYDSDFILESFNSIYDWLVKNKISFVKIKDTFIPIYNSPKY